MCFYYSVNNKKPEKILKTGVVSREHIAKIPTTIVANGFTHPLLPVITNRGKPQIEYYRWGFIPGTIKQRNAASDFEKRFNTLNAKSETASASQAFANALQNKRCLVLASGFFEWQHIKSHKVPYYISQTDDNLFAFAGLWDSWTNEEGQEQFTYTILTQKANSLMSKIHNTKQRMPVILPYETLSNWIAPNLSDNQVNELLKTISSPALKAHTIKPFLSIQNNQINDEILAPHPYPNNSSGTDQQQLTIGF